MNAMYIHNVIHVYVIVSSQPMHMLVYSVLFPFPEGG